MLDSPLLYCPEELTSPPSGLCSSYWKELADASVLGGPIPMDVPIGISSSEKGLSLCLFSPCCVVDVVRGVSCSLSLFLLLSSLMGVWITEVSTVVSCIWGTFS